MRKAARKCRRARYRRLLVRTATSEDLRALCPPDPSASNGALVRPDTVYMFGYARLLPEVAQSLNDARAQALGPKGLSWRARVERVLSEVDPMEAERLRKLTWEELGQEVIGYERSQGEVETDGVSEGVPVEIGGVDWELLPWSPRRHCALQLRCAYGTVHMRVTAPKPNAPNIFIEVGSVALWSNFDWRRFLLTFQVWLDSITQVKDPLRITRADVAYHVQGLRSEQLVRENFVCRAETHRVYNKKELAVRLRRAQAADEHARATGHEPTHMAKLIDDLEAECGMTTVDWFKDSIPQMIGLGRRGSIYCRIYNKTREIQRNPMKRDLFKMVWASAGFDETEDVHNVEFELARSWLNGREFQVEGRTVRIDTLQDFVDEFDTLCGYLVGTKETGGWLRMHKKDHSRFERCTTHEVWDLLRQAGEQLGHIGSWERERVETRATASRALPLAIRLKARLDALRGRDPEEEEISTASMLDAMAEVMADFDLYTKTRWTPERLTKRYRAEYARVAESATFRHGIKPGAPVPLTA